MRVVTLDIETAPISAYVWGLWEQNVGLDMIADDWTILSFSWKTLGEDKVHFVHTGGRGKAKVRDDKALCAALWKVLDDADVVVTHNGVSFDHKKINSRLIFHGFGPPSPYKMVDTLREVKKVAAFSSNKLAALSGKLTKTEKLKHKKYPGFSLWAACLEDKADAWKEMAAYNRTDSVATEQLYLRLRPWMKTHPNVAAYNSDVEVQCPKCESRNVQRRGTAVSNSGVYARIQCQDCGSWGRDSENLMEKDKRRSLVK